MRKSIERAGLRLIVRLLMSIA